MDGAIKENVEIAMLKSGDEVKVSYTLTVPAALTNQYATAGTKTKWIFEAQVQSKPSGGGTNGGYSGGSPKPEQPGPGETIGEEIETPPAGIEEIVDNIKEWIDEHIPRTGDTNIDVIAGVISILSAAGIVFLLWKRKRGKGDEK